MQEDYKRASELLQRYRDGLCTPEEVLLISHWFNHHADNTADVTGDVDVAAIRDEIWERLPASKQPHKRRLWPVWAAAASLLLVVMAALTYFILLKPQQPPVETAYKNDVSPGTTGATLTLANGQQIRLSDQADGTLASQTGVRITKSASGVLTYEVISKDAAADAINTLSTNQGETYEVKLPDGSIVTLNTASSLVYPANLTAQKQRRVALTGEAFFQVAKDAEHPFIVTTGDQIVQVYGTEFNINAYPDEPHVATTLVGGSVKVTAGGKEHMLIPGEQALSRDGGFRVSRVNMDSVTDWKNGDFYLNRADFRTAMRKIARWYNVEVIYDASVPANLRSGGWISRSNNLSTVLKSIENSGLVKFRIEGRKIYVTK